MEIVYLDETSSLAHHGILGQKWGQRNGPPYPLSGGDYSELEKKKIYKVRRVKPNSLYNKKHFDEVLSGGTKISTLSYDPYRTNKVDMFYATHTKLDQHMYNSLFNRPISDEEGKKVLKFKITNTLKKNVKVASEDSGAEAFRSLYKSDRDFYNFVTDPNRMQSLFVTSKYKFRGYRQSRDALNALREGKKIDANDLQKIYRMFNYVIPSDGSGDKRKAKDVLKQRDKFFDLLKNSGYSAVLDTNDAIYGSFKARSPIIVFDMDAIVLDNIKRTNMLDKNVSNLVMVGRKVLGV